MPSSDSYGSAKISSLQIGKNITWPLAWVNWFNIAILCSFIMLPSAMLAAYIAGHERIAIFHAAAIVLLAYPARKAWQNSDVLSAITERWTVRSMVFCLLVVLPFYLVGVAIFGVADGTNAIDPDAFLLTVGPGTFLYYAIYIALPAAAGLTYVRRRRVGENLNRHSLRDVLEAPRSSVAAIPLPLRRKLLGLLLLCGVAIYFVGLFSIPPGGDLAMPPVSIEKAIVAFSLPGFVLLLLARRVLQPGAKAVLSIDGRRPILLLRSFSDDEPVDWGTIRTQLVDPSIEARIARHLSNYGPFIAVGSPEDALPSIGAARAKLSDNEWQARVISWMDESQCILVMIGTTNWLQWEISQVLARGHASKTVLVFPAGSHSHFFGVLYGSFSADMENRLIRLRKALAGTLWSPQLETLGDPQTIRTLLLLADGSVVEMRSSSRSRNSYHLAIRLAFDRIIRAEEERLNPPRSSIDASGRV